MNVIFLATLDTLPDGRNRLMTEMLLPDLDEEVVSFFLGLVLRGQ